MGAVNTFVVRLFVPGEDSPDPEGTQLYGLVEEVASGRNARFASGRELLAFLAAPERGRGRPARQPERTAS